METDDKRIGYPLFAAICFLVLLRHDHHELSYVSEKMKILEYGKDAFGFLDIHGKREVKYWIEKWGYKIPEEAEKNLELEEDALDKLRSRGIYLGIDN